MYLPIPADNKVRIVDATENAVNEAIEIEYATGWIVQQIIYMNDAVMILFEREDKKKVVSIDNFDEIAF